MNVVIIDDEERVRNTIRTLLNENFPDITISASAGSIREGCEIIGKYKPDLVFLDIELPDGNGFDLLRKFSPVPFRVVFITGHHEYAIEAIKVSALDYILKPVDSDEFREAVEKAGKIISREDQDLKFRALDENLKSNKVLKRIILPSFDHLKLVSVSDIIRAEADSNYTIFSLSDGRHITVSRTIKEFENLLSASGLVRVHQSHLVNIDYIDRFVKKDGGYLLLNEGSKIPVSPGLKKKVIQAITDHLYE